MYGSQMSTPQRLLELLSDGVRRTAAQCCNDLGPATVSYDAVATALPKLWRDGKVSRTKAGKVFIYWLKRDA